MRRSSLVASTVLLLLSSPSVVAQDPFTQHRRAYLKGMGGITVVVDHYDGEDEQARQFKTEIELRLRQAGIEVRPGSAVLFLGRHHAPEHAQGPLTCRIQAEIQESGLFERKQGFSELPATTWESSLNGTRQQGNASD